MTLPSSVPHTFRAYNLVKPGEGFSSSNLKTTQLSAAQSLELQPGQVLVKIHAVSLNYRDLMISRNEYGPPLPSNVLPVSDAAGEIIALGAGVSNWRLGQRVCPNFCLDHLDGDPTAEILTTNQGAHNTPGVLAEYKIFPAHSLVEIPEHLSYEEAATLPCAALTAYNALLGLKPLKGGEYVLVLGTGGVSIFALQIAVASGAVVIVTSSSDEKLEIASKLGARHLVNYNKTPNWEEEVLSITGGRGVDHIIEVGGVGTLDRSLKSIKIGGIINIIGQVAQNTEFKHPGLQRAITFKAAILRGILIGSVAQFKNMNRLFSAHKTKPVVDKVFPFEQAPEAYAYLDSQKHVGKVVIKVSQD
jgi:NADPH:quinone reductase-like Zn-dependent oxidoreductase